MSELSSFLNDFNNIVGITPKEEPTAQEPSAPNKPQVIQKDEQQTKKEKYDNKKRKQLVAVKEIYEFVKVYHDKKQPLIEQTKGISKILHPIRAKQAQQKLDKLREENSKNRDYLHYIAPYCRIETIPGELIKKDGINSIYDFEIPLKAVEEVINYLER